jgi:hypothetical protein
MLLTNIVFGSAFIATVAAHGHMLGDAAWINGENMKKACGETIYGNLAADENGPAELQAQMRDRALKEQGMDAKKCDNFQCRGYQPEDNVDRLQHYEVGQEVTQTVIITAVSLLITPSFTSPFFRYDFLFIFSFILARRRC